VRDLVRPAPSVQPNRQSPIANPLFLLLFLFLFLTACLPEEDPGPAACSENGTLFTDDFSGEQDCGWILYEQGSAAASLVEGALRLTTSQQGQIWWTNPGRLFDDAIIIARARQVDGPDDNAYGLICRYQSEQNFYIFLISGDGYYAIGKYQTGSPQIQYLSGEGQYQFSDVINQGVATNEIRASCIGNELSLSINGIPLATVTDPTFVTGDVGLGVSTFQPGTAVVEFDDIRVIAP
jgi:hypothetical protein